MKIDFRWVSVLVAFTVLLTLGHAAEICVDDSDSLVQALADASTNGENDTIMVVRGVYYAPTGGFAYVSVEPDDLRIVGGYDPGCAARIDDPSTTVLDGQEVRRVMRLQAQIGLLSVQSLSFIDGRLISDAGACLNVSSPYTAAVDVEVSHCVFRNCNYPNRGGALYVETLTGSVRIVNTLVADNGGRESGAGEIWCNGDSVTLINNTVTGNLVSTGDDSVGGFAVMSSNGAPMKIYASNNIFYGNSGDYDFFGAVIDGAFFSYHNDYGSILGSPASSIGDLSVDPAFAVGSTDYRLSDSSPLLDQGTNTPPGGLPGHDLDGLSRIANSVVDMGAYEYGAAAIIFRDDFESGDIDNWSAPAQ